jgi:hypothetical protein
MRTSGLSDAWFDRCQAVGSEAFHLIFSAFQLLFHFDTLNFILGELLLLLPVFFRLYGFGVQQKLTRFYNETRAQLLRFMYLFAISTVLCSILQLLLCQTPACMTWDGINYSPLRLTYSSPNLDIVVITILACILITVTIKVLSVASVVAGLFFIGVFVSAVLSGNVTIDQALLSSGIGSWLFFTFRFLPPLFVPLAAVVLAVPSLGYYAMWILEEGNDAVVVSASVVPGIRGCLLLAVNVFLYFRFVRRQENFKWRGVNWDRGRASSSDSSVVAVIPDVIPSGGDMFGTRLKWDIIDGIIAFVFVLACNQFVAQYFSYPLFSVS